MVEQGRLADVGTSDNGDKAAMEIFRFSHVFS
jgi:hypothetical protein